MNIGHRHPLATISTYGISQLHRQNPWMVVWWSAAFPGFGQYLNNQYISGTILTLSEVIINTLCHVNEAIVYTLSGRFDMAREVIWPRWVFGYLVIFFYAMWNSYRTAVHQNKLCQLAELENIRIRGMLLDTSEIQYLETKNPFTAAFYSLLFPGLGQLCNHRVGLSFYAMFWWWVYVSLSHYYESLLNFILGDVQQSISVLHVHWLLYMPSVMGGSVYHAFVTALNQNRLYRVEQRQYLLERYGDSEVCIF